MDTTATAPAAQRAAEVLAFLNGLGTTADEVAVSLGPDGLNVHGGRVFNDCPVANALKAKFRDITYMSVNRFGAYLEFGDVDTFVVEIPMPAPVGTFILAYDGGDAYQHLYAPRETV